MNHPPQIPTLLYDKTTEETVHRNFHLLFVCLSDTRNPLSGSSTVFLSLLQLGWITEFLMTHWVVGRESSMDINTRKRDGRGCCHTVVFNANFGLF